jgi:hypothetical protein
MNDIIKFDWTKNMVGCAVAWVGCLALTVFILTVLGLISAVVMK